MGRKLKRKKILMQRERLLGEQNVLPEPTPVVSNSQKIEELKTKIPEPAVEEPVVLEEPKFETEAEPVEVKKEAPKAQVKKTTKKRAPRKTTMKAKKTTKSNISSKK